MAPLPMPTRGADSRYNVMLAVLMYGAKNPIDSCSFEMAIARWTAAAAVLTFFRRSLKKVITLIFVRRRRDRRLLMAVDRAVERG